MSGLGRSSNAGFIKKVLVFGAFDPLHEGHRDFFRQAKRLGGHLTVVVAHSAAIKAQKGHNPFLDNKERLGAVKAVTEVDEVLLGNPVAHSYELLGQLDFDVIALGYDQMPGDEVVQRELAKIGKEKVEVVRLKAFYPEKFKSTIVRQENDNS